MTRADIELFVRTSIDLLFENDAFLLDYSVQERSISHRLAVYLEREVGDGWHVDCEYDRFRRQQKKTLREVMTLYEKKKSSFVLPDIIIHKRDSDENLLVVEIKKATNSSERDLDEAKLVCYTRDYGDAEYNLHYRWGLFLELSDGWIVNLTKRLRASGTWFEEGEKRETILLVDKEHDPAK